MRNGFTLMELLVVIAVLSLVALLVVPRLPSGEAAALRGSARALAAALRYLGERSVTSRSVYRLHLNMGENNLTITRKLASGDEVPPDDTFLGRRILDAGVAIADVETSRLGKVTGGEVLVDFGAGGLGELLVIHLQGAGGAAYTVTGFPYNGKVTVAAGYQEPAP